jgi:hypothetical protein
MDLRIDGTEVQVRRPRAGRSGRKAFVSGRKKHNTATTTTICDGQGRVLWSGAGRPGRQHDQTAMRTEGIAEQPRLHPQVSRGRRGLPGLGQRVPRPGQRPRLGSPRTTSRSVTNAPGVRHADGSPPSGSAWSTPSASRRSGGRSSGTSAAASTTSRFMPPSPAWSPMVLPAGRPAAEPAPNWCPDRPPADHPPADPPGQHAPTSIAYQVVTCG